MSPARAYMRWVFVRKLFCYIARVGLGMLSGCFTSCTTRPVGLASNRMLQSDQCCSFALSKRKVLYHCGVEWIPIFLESARLYSVGCWLWLLFQGEPLPGKSRTNVTFSASSRDTILLVFSEVSNHFPLQREIDFPYAGFVWITIWYHVHWFISSNCNSVLSSGQLVVYATIELWNTTSKYSIKHQLLIHQHYCFCYWEELVLWSFGISSTKFQVIEKSKYCLKCKKRM